MTDALETTSAVGIKVRPNIENAELPEFGRDFQPYMAARAEDLCRSLGSADGRDQ